MRTRTLVDHQRDQALANRPWPRCAADDEDVGQVGESDAVGDRPREAHQRARLSVVRGDDKPGVSSWASTSARVRQRPQYASVAQPLPDRVAGRSVRVVVEFVLHATIVATRGGSDFPAVESGCHIAILGANCAAARVISWLSTVTLDGDRRSVCVPGWSRCDRAPCPRRAAASARTPRPGDAWVGRAHGREVLGAFRCRGACSPSTPSAACCCSIASRGAIFGKPWALPGGARHEGESARDGALRESGEEAGCRRPAVRARFESVLDLGIWSYSTLVADVTTPFEPVYQRSRERRPGVGRLSTRSIPSPVAPRIRGLVAVLREALAVRPAIVVDVATSWALFRRWWKTRAGAATRLVAKVSRLTERGLDPRRLGLSATRWFPVGHGGAGGQARSAEPVAPAIRGAACAGDGDDEIVAAVRDIAGAFRPVVVVTSDRELAVRVEELGRACKVRDAVGSAGLTAESSAPEVFA